MTIRFLSVVAGAALALAACGGSQESGTVPVDSPILPYEAPESEDGDDDLFADDAFDDLDDMDDGDAPAEDSEGDPGADPRNDEDDSDEGASNSTASEEGASARAGRGAAERSRSTGQAE